MSKKHNLWKLVECYSASSKISSFLLESYYFFFLGKKTKIEFVLRFVFDCSTWLHVLKIFVGGLFSFVDGRCVAADSCGVCSGVFCTGKGCVLVRD